MSFGALSANAIRALNKGARNGGFYHDTGEGGISPYHREFGGDLVWQLASGYFGARRADGGFDPQLFAAAAQDPQIKMLALKLSQGAKPGHGGVLPAAKLTIGIANALGIRRILDHPDSGMLSALGMGLADVGRVVVATDDREVAAADAALLYFNKVANFRTRS